MSPYVSYGGGQYDGMPALETPPTPTAPPVFFGTDARLARSAAKTVTLDDGAGGTTGVGLVIGVTRMFQESGTNFRITGSSTYETIGTFKANGNLQSTSILQVRVGAGNDQLELGNNVGSGKATIAFGADTQLHRESAGVLMIPTAGGGLRLKSPDGLTLKTITINNAGAITLI
jgi:hypothetical protein